MKPKTLMLLAGALLVVVLIAVAVWLTGDDDAPLAIAGTGGGAVSETAPPETAEIPTFEPGVAPPSIAKTKLSTDDYDAQITEALANDDISNAEARRILLAIAYDKSAEVEIRLEALEHGLNLMDDEDFGEIAPMWVDVRTPNDLLETLDFDLHGRGQRVALKNYLEVAKLSDHPMQEDAMDFVSFFVDEEYGTDWNAWDDAIEAYLRENIDEDNLPAEATQ